MSGAVAPPTVSAGPPSASPPPADTDRVAFAATITWRQLLAVIGGASTVTAVLVGVIYSGLKGDIGGVQADIRLLQQHFNAATVAGISVKDALSQGTALQQEFKETHDAALRNGDKLEELIDQQQRTGAQVDSLGHKLEELTGRQERTGGQVDSLALKLDGLTTRVDAIKSDTDRILGAVAAAGLHLTTEPQKPQ